MTNTKSKFTFSVIVFIVFAIVFTAYICPPKNHSYYKTEAEISATVLQNDMLSFNDCTIDESGLITPNGDDPFVVFRYDESYKSLAINYTATADFKINTYLYNNGTITENLPFPAYCSSDSSKIYIPTNRITGDQIRIDFNDTFTINSLEFYTASAELITEKTEYSPVRYFLSIFMALPFGLLAWVLEMKKALLHNIIIKIKNNRKKVAISFLAILISLGISSVFEFIYTRYFNNSTSLLPARILFLSSLLLLIYFSVYFFKTIKDKPEVYFAIAIFLLCLCIMTAQPFGHNSWDIDSHYHWVLDASYLGAPQYTEADTQVFYTSKLFTHTDSIGEYLANVNVLNELDYIPATATPMSPSVSHIPSGIFVAVARLFGASFYEKYLVGQLANLIIYSLVCYFGMRVLKSGKMIFAAAAMVPTSIFMAANFSYDTWVTAFSLLGMAYFIKEMQDYDKPVSLKNTVIMCTSFAIAALPKLPYITFLAIPFFLIKKGMQKTDKKKYYTICSIAFLAVCLMLFLYSFSKVQGSGDLRGGLNVNPVGQIKYILSNPFTYSKTLLSFLNDYFSFENAKFYLTHYAYAGIAPMSTLYLIIAAIVVFTDKNGNDRFSTNWLLRALAIIFVIGTSSFIATALYIDFNDVGNSIINGCQPRYLIPLIYPLFALIGPKKILNQINRSLYNSAILYSLVGINLFNILLKFLPY